MAASLAIVVVNYASTDLLRRHLVRTAAGACADHVIVVDNFSSAIEQERVRDLAEMSGWHLITSLQNVGFGAGVNLGADYAWKMGATDVLLLNPDAYIDAADLEKLRVHAEAHRHDAVAPRILDSEGRIWFDGADLYLKDGLTLAARKRSQRAHEGRWPWLTGACLFIPEPAWHLAGGFDEDYFLYWEDVDFSRRLVKAGGGLRVVEDAVAVHDEGGTQQDAGTRAKSDLYYYYNIRNRLLFAARHLEPADIARWNRGAWASAYEVLLRGGRRQFLRPWRPLAAAWRGLRDGRRIVSNGAAAGGRATDPSQSGG